MKIETREQLSAALSNTFADPIYLTLDNCTIKILCSDDELRHGVHNYFGPLSKESCANSQITVKVIDGEPPVFEQEFEIRQPELGENFYKRRIA